MRLKAYDVDVMSISKAARFAEFLDRLGAAPKCASAQEAADLIASTLTSVENELSGVPYDPNQHLNDGRMYAAQSDSVRTVDGRPELRRYRSRAHNTYVSDDGAILILTTKGVMVFSKSSAANTEVVL